MKILRKVPRIEVKRCFVVANLCAKRTHRGHMKKIESASHYLKRLRAIESRVLRMKEDSLDKIIGDEYEKRLLGYNQCKWHLAVVQTSEMGVWSRAGELPLRWTNKTLADTAVKVRRAIGKKHGFRHPHIRAAHAIPGILKTSVDIIQHEKHLLPIVFKGNTGTRGRRRLKMQTKCDVDDGCMRSIALATHGLHQIKVYYGIPK